MLTCFACKAQFSNTRSLCHHLRSLCFAALEKTVFHCGEEGCFRHFHSIKSLSKHINLCHKSESSLSNSDEPLNNDALVINAQDAVMLPPPTETLQDLSFLATANNETSSAENILSHDMSLFIASLYANPIIPRSTVQVVVEGIQSFLEQSLDNVLKTHFHELVRNGSVTKNAISVVDQILNLIKKAVTGFRSEHTRFDNFSKCGTLMSPIEVVVGQRMEMKRTRLGLTYVPVNCTMQITPLRLILQKFFTLPNVLKDTLDYLSILKKDCNSGPITNFVQGSVWQNFESSKCSNDDVVLPLILYYDDFEIGNPLGSHAGIHKLGGVYVSLPCLGPSYSSQLSYIFVLGLFHSSDRVQFGNGMVFRRIIDEINYLSETGIIVNTNSYQGTIKFRLGALTGDNLGLHSMLGFVESFSANYPCRICTASKDAIRTMCYEDLSLVRDMTNYNALRILNDVSQSGIKDNCVWLDVKDFNLFNNVAVDLLHDLLEGICVKVMSFVITQLIKAKLFHLKNLTDRMFAFDFGPDSSSKPSSTGLQFDGPTLKIRTSASEMSVLVRYFGLLVGYYVQRDNEIWNLYILLRKIMYKLYSVQVYNDSCEQLKFLISEFNLLYMTLSKKQLTPKFHFLVHYPEMLKKFGPITQMWTMRFEAKHRVAKIAARSSASRVNITKTIALKLQLQLNYLFLKNEALSSVEYGKRKQLKKTTILELNKNFELTGENVIECSLSWVKLNGVKFTQNSVITVDLLESTCLPSFAIIRNIYIDKANEVLFSCSSLKTIDFDEHFFAYEVETTDLNVYIAYKKLIAPVTNTMTVMSDLTTFVTLRWSFD